MSPARSHMPGLRARTARAGERRLWRAPSLLLAMSAGMALAEEAITLPSGQAVTLHDIALERQADGQVWLVLRYLAPRVAREEGDLRYEDVVDDLDALCASRGMSEAAKVEGRPDQIVVALMDRPIERGVPDPQATQLIAAYGIGPEGCEWR